MNTGGKDALSDTSDSLMRILSYSNRLPLKDSDTTQLPRCRMGMLKSLTIQAKLGCCLIHTKIVWGPLSPQICALILTVSSKRWMVWRCFRHHSPQVKLTR